MEVKGYWMKIILLAIYLILIFIISRVSDVVHWYKHGYFPHTIVDPSVLNVRQIKQLLDSRGISYTGVLEKSQLVQVLNHSGHVVHSELNMSSNSSERLHESSSLEFTGGSHFNEKVEDTKDSVWLVQVIPPSHKHIEPLLDDYSWRYIQTHLAPFAVQTGVFDCNLDKELCVKRNWLEPILLLALPRGNRPKDHVVIRTSKSAKINMIFKWVKDQLSSRVEKITSVSQLEEDWLSNNATEHTVKVVLFTHLLHTPLFFAALSIRFTGRIKFGIFSMKKEEDDTSSDPKPNASSNSSLRQHIMEKHNVTSLPAYLVIGPYRNHMYGSLPGEHFNLGRMNLLLKSLVPELNDVFIVALVLINMITILQICQLQGVSSWLYLIRASFLVITSNLFLFIVSLILYHLSLPLPPALLLSPIHCFNFSSLGAMFRSDLLYMYSHPMLFVLSYVLYGFITAKLFQCQDTPWYECHWFPWANSLIVNSLFRPSETPIRHFSSDARFDLRFEQLVISRSPRVFNVPNLWLQAPPPVDYISDLPVFEYKGWQACPHKEMRLIEQVMDGDSPHVLHKSTDQHHTEWNGNDCLVITPTNTPRESRVISLLGHVTEAENVVRPTSVSPLRKSRLESIHATSGHTLPHEIQSNNISPLRESRLDYHLEPRENISRQGQGSSSIGYAASDAGQSPTRATEHTRRSRVDIRMRVNTSPSSANSLSNGTHLRETRRTGYNNSTASAIVHASAVDAGDASASSHIVSDDGALSNMSFVTSTCSVPNKLSFSNEPYLVNDTCDYLQCRLYKVQDCAICLESYASKGTILMALPCAHHFHKTCVLSWLRRGHAQCPVCRWPAYKQKFDFSY